ncbi:sigma-70 family RNA polymerase sigma factor [uncultured Halopseudomonas sp.]|jgi:RNA polymerase sigma-70 factor (ECF subfamily)|uniref:sigma-70 family RNA polymerase sigma factor n=1 Tax=uncultured Halopseudomonas sp. TaxID=2901193 RepID=UPI0030EBB786|tara:strand:- start:23028 stop:23576 length:549 start_codon:yes stop_codon:yes gene_type:complete
MDEEQDPSGIAPLLMAIAQQDQQSFEQLYRLTSAKLFGICKRMLVQSSDAEDVLQEVYLTVWAKASQFDAQRGKPDTWLTTIARSKCIDRLRLGGVDRHTDLIDLDQLPEPEKIDPVEFASDKQRLDNCLSNLQNQHRTVIRTAFLDGCTYHDLAARTGVPLGTMKSWIRRGLMSLKACLEK